MIPFVVYDFFYEPLPNFYYQQHSIPPKDIQSYFFYPLLAQGRAIRRNHLNRLDAPRWHELHGALRSCPRTFQTGLGTLRNQVHGLFFPFCDTVYGSPSIGLKLEWQFLRMP